MIPQMQKGPLGALSLPLAAATAAAATAATFAAVAQQQDGDDDQPNGVILKETAEAVIHIRFLHCGFRERFALPTIKI